MTYALDASAVLRYLDGEAGSARVSEILKDHIAGRHKATISAVHWGEIAGVTYKARGREAVDLVVSRLFSFGLEIVPVTAERALGAALIEVRNKISYADAFGVELVSDAPEHVLVTADFDLQAAAHEVKIEFLPRK